MSRELDFDPFALDAEVNGGHGLAGDPDLFGIPDAAPQRDPVLTEPALETDSTTPSLRVRCDGRGVKLTIVDPRVSPSMLRLVAEAAGTTVDELVLGPYRSAVAGPVLEYAAELERIDADRNRRLEALRLHLPGNTSKAQG